jgi:hypothetical protein
MSSGYLCLEWVYGDDVDDWENVANLEYWDVHALAEAMKPIAEDRRHEARYWQKKDPDNHGTDVAVAAADSADATLKALESALKKMRNKFREDNDNDNTT